MNISIVIPTFNGKELLVKYLPSVMGACKNYSLDKTELIIVDDASNDGTEDYLKLKFPFIKIIRHNTNKGFSASANNGVFSSKNKIVVLLNSDIEVSNNFLTFFQPYFKDKDVFAVRPGLKNSPGDEIIKNPRIAGGFKYGFFDVPKEARNKLKFAFFSGGGASAFDKEKFIALGGFDEMFSPFYYEDVDLSYRAWKRGWKIIYEPRSLAYHRGGTTISRFFKKGHINTISERNKYFLVWKNITDKKLLLQHFIFIPVRIVFCFLTGRFTSIVGFFYALSFVKKIIKKRKLEKQFTKVSDNYILGQFKQGR